MTRLLVTGAGGLLGAAIVREFARNGEVLPYDRAALDVTSESAIADALAASRPDVVINCAAWTDVDGAEESEDAALAVNGAGAGNVAGAAAAGAAPLSSIDPRLSPTSRMAATSPSVQAWPRGWRTGTTRWKVASPSAARDRTWSSTWPSTSVR